MEILQRAGTWTDNEAKGTTTMQSEDALFLLETIHGLTVWSRGLERAWGPE